MPKSKRRRAAIARAKAAAPQPPVSRGHSTSDRLRHVAPDNRNAMPVNGNRERAPKTHMASQAKWAGHNLWPFCGPNPMGNGPLTADWAEVTCKNCLRQKDTSDPGRLEGVDRARRRLVTGQCPAYGGRPCRHANDPIAAALPANDNGHHE